MLFKKVCSSSLDIRPLQGKGNELRLRVGKYRIIYQYEDNSLVILDIDSRGDIYK